MTENNATEHSVVVVDNEPVSETTTNVATSEAGYEEKSSNRARDAYRQRDVAASRLEHLKAHTEPHKGGVSEYVKAVVFGGLDGIVTTFAIIAAAAGAGETYKVILIFGFANVFADAFSMGFGEFISGSAERDYALSERRREEWEVENCLDLEIKEMVELYTQKGLTEEDANTVVKILSKDPKVFVDFMMVDELQLLVDVEDKYGPVKSGAVMFTSFIFFGTLPLLTYVGGKGQGTDYIFGIATAITGVALLILGAIKGYLTMMNVPLAALMMLFNGSVSGGVSYGIGVLVELIVS